jgi:hypothetical protein
MQMPFHNRLSKWINSDSYNELIKNTEDLAVSMSENSFKLDKKVKKECIQLFKKTILKDCSPEMSLSSRFIEWFSKAHHTMIPKFVLEKLKCELSAEDPQIAEIFTEMINATEISERDEIFEAISEEDIDFIQEMGSVGVNFNVQDEDGITPLFWAVLNNNVGLLNTLIKFGANPNIADADGDTALMQAAAKNYKECVSSLLASAEIDINQRNNKGYHALSNACIGGNTDIVEILLKNGADINLQDKWGRSIFVHLTFINHSDQHQSILELMAGQLDPETLFMHKEILRLIALAHSTNGVGVSQITGNNNCIYSDPIYLEGGLPQYWLRKMCKATKAFSFRYPELMQENTSEHLTQLLYSANTDSNQELFERCMEGLPILLNSGFKKHLVCVLIWGHYFVLCNRGEASRRSIEVYQFNPENLNLLIIDRIKKAKRLDEDSYLKLFFEELPSLLQFNSKGNRSLRKGLEEACAYEPQTSDNCSWASPELAVFTFLMMNEFLGDSKGYLSKKTPKFLDKNKIDEARTKFDEWSAFNQMYHLERYLGPRHLRNDNIEKQQNSFLRRKAYVVDNRLLLSSMRSIIKTIPWHSERIEELKYILAKTLIFNEKENYDKATQLIDSLFDRNAEEVLKKFTDGKKKKPEELSSGLSEL